MDNYGWYHGNYEIESATDKRWFHRGSCYGSTMQGMPPDVAEKIAQMSLKLGKPPSDLKCTFTKHGL